jgi:autotransporter-associated beta strand protein
MRTCQKFLWSALSIFILVLFYIPVKAQTTYDWLNTAPDANWRQGAFGARWNPGGLFNEPPFGILSFNNNHQLVMNNNVAGTYNQHQIVFGTFNTSTRTLNGNPIRFFDFNFGATEPKIENYSNATHIINLNITGDGDAGDPLEVNPINGGLTLNGTLNNQGSPVFVFGNNGQTVTFNGVISGAGGFEVRQNSTAVFTAVNTYTGSTTVVNGVLQLSTNGLSIPSANAVTINGGTLLISNAAATSSARNITLTAGTLALGAVASGSTTTVGTVAISAGTNLNLSAAPTTCTFVMDNTSGLGSSGLTIQGWLPTKRILLTNTAHISTVLGNITFAGFGVGARLINGNELVPSLLHYTNGTGGGNFSAPASWLASGGQPPLPGDGTRSIYIQPGDVLTVNTNFSALNIQIGGTLNMNSGNTLTVAANGIVTHNGPINMADATNIISLGNDVVWNSTGGTFTGSPVGRLHFLGTGTVNGTVTFPTVWLEGGVNFGTGATIGGSSSLQLNAGFVVTNPPTYASGSTLIYNRNANRDFEWSASPSVRGIPHHVRVNAGFTVSLDVSTAYNGEGRTMLGDLDIFGFLDMGGRVADGGSMAEDLVVGGSVTIRNGATLRLGCQQPGFSNIGDIEVGGDWNHEATGTFTPSQRAVIFNGSNPLQLVNFPGTREDFAYFIIAKTGNGTVRMNCNSLLFGSNRGAPLQILNGNLDLNGYTMTFQSYNDSDPDIANHVNQNILIDGSGSGAALQRRIFNTSGTPANFVFTHSNSSTRVASVTRNTANLSTLLFDENVVVQIGRTGTGTSGVNFGNTVSTINSNAILQINAGGFVDINPPTYADLSLLRYNTGGDYNRSVEWSTASSGPGHPFNVQIARPAVPQTRLIAGPTVAYSTTALNLRGSLTIDAGNTFDMTNAAGGTATNMAVPLTAGLDINISGTLIASQNTGGDIVLGRSWTRLTGGIFTHNNRSVTFNSSNNGTVAGPGAGESFFSAIINKNANNNTITLNSPVTITNNTALTMGVFVSSVLNLFIMNAGTTYTGGSTNSFVGGPLKKIGNTPFTYPVGKIAGGANHYRTIGISAPGNLTDEFTAEFHRNSSYNVGTITPIAANGGWGLQWVSACEFWDLVRDAGGSTVSVTLSWTSQSRCNAGRYINDFGSLVVVENLVNPRSWGSITPNWGNNYGGTVNGGSTNTDGTITWATTSIYHRFTLGTTDTRFNPLPFALLQFEGLKRSADVLLQWKVAGNQDQQQYTVEHSADGITFKAIAVVAAIPDLNNASYSALHAQPVTGLNYYRITARSRLNQSQSSQTIQVWFGKEVGKPGIYPNPIVNSQVNIHTNGLPKGVYNIHLVGMDGKLLQQQRWVHTGNQPVYQLQLNPALPRGMYWIHISGDMQEPIQLKILK